jgi:hypothetical protein
LAGLISYLSPYFGNAEQQLCCGDMEELDFSMLIVDPNDKG